LVRGSAEPLDSVGVTGLSDVDDDVYVDFRTSSGTIGVTALVTSELGQHAVVAPPYLDDLLAGGRITLTITDGLKRCPELVLDVLPLAAAAGDPLTEIWLTLEEIALALADQLGATRDELAVTLLRDLPPEWVTLAMLFEALDSFDPAVDLADLDADELSFVQALLAELDYESVLADMIASVDGLPRPPAVEPASSFGEGAAKPSGAQLLADFNERAALPPSVKLSAASAASGCKSLGAVPRNTFDVGTPENLSAYLKAARGARDSLGPLSQSITDMSVGFAVLGLAAPPVGRIFGWLAFGAQLIQQMRANLYPNAITRLEFQINKTQIEEDWDTAPEKDGEIRWAFAKIWSTNSGMSLARVGIDLIATGAGLPGGFQNAVANHAVGALDIAGKAALNERLNELEQDPDSEVECWGVEATEFGPTVVPDGSGEDWVFARILSGDAVSIDGSDRRKIEPEKIGTATLRVQTQADPFPGPFGFGDRVVEVLRKSVRWIPTTLFVDHPGQSETVKFRIDNAKHDEPQDVSVVPGPGLGPLPVPVYSGGVHTLTFTTPSDTADYPTRITARSTSKELPPDTPERSGFVTLVTKEEIEISPREVCVPRGEDQTFTATVSGSDDLVVRWEIESGAGTLSATTGETIDYMAPNSNGMVTLRAYSSEDDEVEDRITFRHGVCVGLAAYYGQLVKIDFPFLPGGDCSNPDIEDQFEEITIPEEGALPSVLPEPSDLWMDRSETYHEEVFGGGSFGERPGSDSTCVTKFFSADARLDASLVGSPSGDRLDIDISTTADSNCTDMGDGIGMRCSAAVSHMSVVARYDFDLTQAKNYRLRISLSCDGYSPPTPPGGLPADFVSIITVRVASDGTVLPPTDSTAPILTSCGPTQSSVEIDQLLVFATPAAPSEKDHVMVLFNGSSLSLGNVEQTEGSERHTGFMRGFISVTQQELHE
jgi:hypothetical protein